MRESLDLKVKGKLKVSRADTKEVLFQSNNVICNNSRYLFAQLMANVNPVGDTNPPYTLGHTMQYAVWGLAIGAGASSWAPETQPVAVASQTSLVTEFLRKPLSQVTFVDDNDNPLTTISTNVNFQTTVNATSDNITQSIREMGLIGGTVTPGTNMLTAPYFNGNASSYSSASAAQSTIYLLNSLTLPPLNLPQSTDVAFDWIMSF